MQLRRRTRFRPSRNASFRAERGTFAASGCTSLWKLMMAVAKSLASSSLIPKSGIRSFSSGWSTRFRSNERGSRIFSLNQSTFVCGMSWTKAKSRRGSSFEPSSDSSIPIGCASSKPAISWQLKQP